MYSEGATINYRHVVVTVTSLQGDDGDGSTLDTDSAKLSAKLSEKDQL
jgi:hypothetical protein